MKNDVVLKNGLVVTPNGVIRGGIGIVGEQIVEVGATPHLGSGKQEIDLKGKILFPGCFDPHVHFGIGDEAGDEVMVQDFLHDSRDCLLGGVTTISTTTLIGSGPLHDYFGSALRCAADHAWCDYKFTNVVTVPDQLKEIPDIAAQGAVSYKFFTGYAGEQAAGFGMNPEGITTEFFNAACETFARCGPPVFPAIHAEEPFIRGRLVDRLRQMGRADKLVAWAETSPEWAESLQVYTYGLIANHYNIPIYPVHIHAAHTVDTVKQFHAQGMKIVGETVSVFLMTTAHEMDAKGMGSRAKIQPPIRFEKDKERLWQGIREGTITVVGTDSVPYSARYKDSADFWECRVGVNMQVADTMALLFDEGINNNRIDLVTLAKVTSENAAKMYGIYPKKGAIEVGSDADVIVFDQDKEVTLGVDRTRGKSSYSLWEGKKVKGVPVMTFLRGSLVMQDGEIVAKSPGGQHVEQVVRPRRLS